MENIFKLPLLQGEFIRTSSRSKPRRDRMSLYWMEREEHRKCICELWRQLKTMSLTPKLVGMSQNRSQLLKLGEETIN